MIVSNDELVCANSIISKEKLFGINLIIPQAMIKSDFVNQTIHKFHNSGFIDKTNILTEQGLCLLRTIEEYKNAESYIIVNDLKLAQIGDNKLIGIIKKDDKYFIDVGSVKSFVDSIMNHTDFFSSKCNAEEKSEFCSLKKWKNMIKDLDKIDYIYISKYYKRKEIIKKIYYIVNEKIYIYEINSHRLRTANSIIVRNELLNIFIDNQGEKIS